MVKPHLITRTAAAVLGVLLPAVLMSMQAGPSSAEEPDPVDGSAASRNVGVYWAGPESYRKLQELGARLVVSNVALDTRIRLYWARRHGLRLILFNSSWIDDSAPGGRANRRLICKNVRSVGNHPALWGYYVIDEPSKHQFPDGRLNPVSVATMRTVNRTVKRCDPRHPTLAVILPGEGFGTRTNPFDRGVADHIMFDLYPKTPDGIFHPELITDFPLPRSIDILRARDPEARIWMAVQAFGGCGSSGCFSAMTADELRREIELTARVFREKRAALDGMFFFLWDRTFDDRFSLVTEDMRGHREFWPLIELASRQLSGGGSEPAEGAVSPRSAGSPAARVVNADPAMAVPRTRSAGNLASGSSFCSRGAGILKGTITGVAGSAITVGARTFTVDASTAVFLRNPGTPPVGLEYLQPGAKVTVFPYRRVTLGVRAACQVIAKPVPPRILKIAERAEPPSGGVLLTLTGAGSPFRTLGVGGPLATSLRFANPRGQPPLQVSGANLQPGTSIRLRLGYIAESPTHVRAAQVDILPVISGVVEVIAPATASDGDSAWAIRPAAGRPFTSAELDRGARVQFRGKNAQGTLVTIPLTAAAVQPQGRYRFYGVLEGSAAHLHANLVEQLPRELPGIVIATASGGAQLNVMGPDFLDPENAVFRLELAGARVLRLRDGAFLPLAPASIRPFSTVLFKGYFTGPASFQVIQAVVVYLAPPAP